MKLTYEDIIKLIDDTDNDDENVVRLQKAMEHYCSMYDKCEGYKYALRMCLEDQYNNHPDDQEDGDLEELSDILNGAI